LDPNLIRHHPEEVKKAAESKGVKGEIVEKWLRKDKERRELEEKVNKLRAERNRLAEEFKKRKPTQEEIKKARKLRKEIQELEERWREKEKEWKELLWLIPNPPAKDVPPGRDERDNVEVKKWGKIPQFSFSPRDYLEIAEKKDIIDVKRAAKVSGSRFGYLKGEAVLLEYALISLGGELLLQEGFTPVLPPVMLKKEMEAGLGYGEHGGWDDMYILEKDNLVLVATSEHSLVTMHADEILPEEKLPLRYFAFSTCFRREAGSYGKDTRGILRVHQFNKLEMVVFTKPEDSDKEHEYMVSLEEKLMQRLGLPYRVVKMCSGDLGMPAARKYDIEVWFPSQNRYRETHSCSNCTDFQARRLNIRFKRGNKTEFVHILNGTVFSERPLLAILENYQQKDGSVIVPEALRKWVGKEKI